MSNDTDLLRQYVEERSESAFGELVREHLNAVYSAALRETGGDGAQAEDVSQAVFTELARKGPRLLGHPCLAAWLYTSVRRFAANWRRAERHRRRREQEAQSMNELLAEDSPNEVWQRIGPVLDDALHQLRETDRAALVLRFLEARSLSEVGVRLGLNENAARMRVDRALDKLRGLLARRGITSTASGLAAAMAAGVLIPAPATLAATVAGTALAGGAVAGSTLITLMELMNITAVKAGLIGIVILAGLATPAWQQTRLERARAENARWRAQAAEAAALRGEVARLREVETNQASEMGRLRGVEADRAELEQLRQWKAQTQRELLRLRGMAGVARRANFEAEALRAQLAGRSNVSGAAQNSGAMNDLTALLMQQRVDGQLSRLKATLHLTPEQLQAARDILLRQAQLMSAGVQQGMSGQFDMDKISSLAKDAGDPDEQIQALLTPEQKANYKNYKQEEATYNARQAANVDLFTIQSTLGLTSEQEDRAFAALYDFDLNQLNGGAAPASKPASTNLADLMHWTMVDVQQWNLDQKAKALEPVLTPTQMGNYRQQQALQLQAAKDMWTKMGLGSGGSK